MYHKEDTGKWEKIGKAKLKLNKEVKLCLVKLRGLGLDGSHHRVGDVA